MTTDRPLGSRYVLGPVLGRGSTGQVHEGRRVADGARFAVKVLREDWVEDDEILHCLFQERRALAVLDHPNVVKVVDLVVDGGQAGIVLERVAGGTLGPLIRTGPLPADRVADIGRQLALALAAAHAANVVHGDVKPENVLVAAADPLTVKLGDFGVARLVDAVAAQTTARGGTPKYMAPELVTGGPAGPAGDVYALGVLLYEALAGRPPFTGDTPAELWRAHAELPPPRPDGIADDWWELLRGMLAKAPGDRPTAVAVAAVLAAGLAGPDPRPLGPAPEAAVERRSARASRVRRLAASGVAAGALLVILGALAWAGVGRAAPGVEVPPSPAATPAAPRVSPSPLLVAPVVNGYGWTRPIGSVVGG